MDEKIIQIITAPVGMDVAGNNGDSSYHYRAACLALVEDSAGNRAVKPMIAADGGASISFAPENSVIRI